MNVNTGVATVVPNAVNVVLAGLTLTDRVMLHVVHKVLLPLLLLLLLLVVLTKNAGIISGKVKRRDVHQCVNHVKHAINLCGEWSKRELRK